MSVGATVQMVLAESRQPRLGGELAEYLRSHGFSRLESAFDCLKALTADDRNARVLQTFVPTLMMHLTQSADPDMALLNFERFIAASNAPSELLAEIERDRDRLQMLIRIFSTSQYFSDLIIRHPEDFDALRNLRPDAAFRSREELLEELRAAIRAADSHEQKLNRIGRFKAKELLRIGYMDLAGKFDLDRVVLELSHLAQASIEGALQVARVGLIERHGEPKGEGGLSTLAVIGLGKLGGRELNYSSDIDLLFVYSEEGNTEGAEPIINQEFFDKLASLVINALTHFNEEGSTYRVDMRLRPLGTSGQLTVSLDAARRYYHESGRTWERQALIKARPVAGDMVLGERFLEAIESFVYKPFLSYQEIMEIKGLKRHIERAVDLRGETLLEVKSGYGGIRDIEFTVQFLQLAHGGARRELRHPNTIEALGRLTAARLLRPEEAARLEKAYRLLRTVEHRLQNMHQLQLHSLPDQPEELTKLAKRLGFADLTTGTAREQFTRDLADYTGYARKMLDRVLHNLFGEKGADPDTVDIIVNPSPAKELIGRTMKRYNFADPVSAYTTLRRLTEEPSVILAGPRTQELFCRIAPRLLQLISVAPDPDMALINFERCTASIGARKVMYELFSEHPRTLELFVDLCAWSQFLTDILVRSPGMMDQIMDYLMVGRRKSTPEMEKELNELVESVEDPLDELLGYKDQEMLRIGIRDIIGEAPLLETMQDLANLAEATLRTVWRIARAKLQSDAVVRLAVIGCGKLGGQEMSYSSDLDVIFVYEAAPGVEDHLAGPAATRLAQQILNMLGEPTNRGKLYPVDPRLRPTGRSGSLVISLASFWNYFQQSADLWEFQAMTRARLIACDEELRPMLEALLPRITYGRPWRPAMAKSVLKMRGRLETAGGSRSIKRGFGGIVDIEFATQMLLLKHAVTRAELRSANTFEALKRIYAAGLIDDKVYEDLSGAYLFLRLVEDRLRIVNNIAEEELPTGPAELDRLAKRLGYMGHTPEETRQMFIEEYSLYTRRTRELFLDLVEIERQAAGEEWGPQDTRLAGTSRRM